MVRSSLSGSGGGLTGVGGVEDALQLLLQGATVEQGEQLVDDGETAVDQVAQRLWVVPAEDRCHHPGDLLLDEPLHRVAVEGEVLDGEARLRGEAGVAARGD